MDTCVYDPFYEEMPRFFGMTLPQLLEAKHPTAWAAFERGHCDEAALAAAFFRDGRPVDGAALAAHMASHYRWLDGVEPLLARLRAAGVEMHCCSNYPAWWRAVEVATGLSRYAAWTFLSCEGPMAGHRKPEPAAFAAAAAHLGAEPGRLLLVDDRQANVDGARAAGLRAVLFTGCAARLERDLVAEGVEL